MRADLAGQGGVALRAMLAHVIAGADLWRVDVESQRAPKEDIAESVEGCSAEAAFDLKRRAGLYYEAPGTVEITDNVLYRGRIQIPARVPVGRFTAETFLIRDGRVLAAAVREIDIRKSGFERWVAGAAEQHAMLYGIAAVLLSIGFGWAAGAIFRRF